MYGAAGGRRHRCSKLFLDRFGRCCGFGTEIEQLMTGSSLHASVHCTALVAHSLRAVDAVVSRLLADRGRSTVRFRFLALPLRFEAQLASTSGVILECSLQLPDFDQLLDESTARQSDWAVFRDVEGDGAQGTGRILRVLVIGEGTYFIFRFTPSDGCLDAVQAVDVQTVG